MLKLGSIYPRYVGPRSNIPGGTLDGGYVRFATPVWGLHSNGFNSFATAWNIDVRKILGLPYTTHLDVGTASEFCAYEI